MRSLRVRTKQVIKVMRANDKGDKKNRFKISVSIGQDNVSGDEALHLLV